MPFRLARGRTPRTAGSPSPASDSAREAEGEGFEPSIRLTTDNGFRAPVFLAWTGDGSRVRDTLRDSRPRRNP